MRAAVLEAFSAPLKVQRVPVPIPDENEVLVRVRAVGLCGSDLKLVAGVTPGTVLPLIPGHEVAGELVTPTRELEAGRRVACYTYEGCGRCRWCRSGEEMLCPDAGRIGRNRQGGLAGFIAIRSTAVIPFDEPVGFAEAAVAMDAVTTPLHALRHRARLARGESLAIVGAGGLGLNAVQLAVAVGAKVAVVEPSEVRRDDARRLGAAVAVAPDSLDELADVLGEGADAVLEVSGTRAGFETAVSLARRGGRIVFCGYRPGYDVTVDSARLAMDELTLLGCRAGRLADAVAALAAVKAGEVTPAIAEVLPLERVNDGLALLRSGDAAGRVVIAVA